ncbi:MAG: DUF4423 domain-containing protein [Proteobacteria bacterium]|nr:DUF4423 domain-containing protein [Pseudomonadota bacterium]
MAWIKSEFLRSYLKKAEATLDYGNFEERDMRVTTFAMNKNDLNYARQKLANFRRELSDELESRGEPNMVVALNTNLFPLTIDQLN